MKHNLLSFILVILTSLGSVTAWGAIYESTLTSADLASGATVTGSDKITATETCYQTSSSNGYLTITFSPTLSLSNGDKIVVTWCPNTSSNRTPKYAINGASTVNMTTAKGMDDVDYEIPITSTTTLTTLTLQGAGSSGIQFKKISVQEANKTVYLNLNDFTDWEKAEAKFRIWDGTQNINMTAVEDDCGHVYKASIGKSVSEIYVKRCKSDYTEEWNNVHIADLGTNDMVTVTDWTAGSLGTYPPTLKVIYKANGGSGSMAEETGITCGTDVTLTSNTFTKSGMAFTGWNTKSDGTGTAYADGATITVAGGHITLYAQWGVVYSLMHGTIGSETRINFEEKGLPHERQINNFILPNTLDATQNFWVEKNGAFCTSNLATITTAHHFDKSEKMAFSDLKFAKVIEPGDCSPASSPRFVGHEHNVAGVIGTIRIIDNSDYANVQASFMPNGFAMLYGDAGHLDNTLAFVNHHDMPNIWKSNPINMSSDFSGTGKQYYIGLLKSDGTYAFCDMSEEANLPDIIAATDGTYGRFRMTEKTCHKNFECEFMPTYRIIYHANYPVGVSPADTYSEDVMNDETMTLHLATPTAPTGYTFKGWTAAADGSGTVLSAGGEYILNHPTADVELYAQWDEVEVPCATVQAVYSSYYIKQGRVAPPIPLFEGVEGVSSWTITPAIAGCTYEKEGDIIYLKGVPTGITANTDVTLAFKNNDEGCTATMTIHQLAATAEPTLAYIVVGTKNGDFTAGVKPEQSTSHPLYQYIEDNGYALTACNEYSTVDEKAIVEYYSQYDIVLITDYPSTKEKNSANKSYGNALGVLVDKVPILSMETFLSGNSNWSKIGLSANPHTPQIDGNNNDQFKMDLLCPAHNVFIGTSIIDGQITAINSFTEDGDKNTTGLQGFTSMEAPDDFIFIATIDGGDYGTLVTCCERQTVVEARLLLFGVNYYGSERMTNDGKLAVKQMLDYLLRKERTHVADCADVFDNGLNTGGRTATVGGHNYTSGDNQWSNPANWTGSQLPKALQAILVEQPCIVNIPNAHASSIKLCKGTNSVGIVCDGKLTIRPEGSLAVSSSITKVSTTDHVTTSDIAASDLVVEAKATHQGALALGTYGHGTPATVQYYSKAVQSETASTWQYMGVPFTEMNSAMDYFAGAWMCRWIENTPDGAAGANWAYLANEDALTPFQGYAITQPTAMTYTHTGRLLPADTRTITLSYTSTAANTYKGCNLVANSWMAPIRVKDFAVGDFQNAEATVYIYNTGSYTDWEDRGEGEAGIQETTTAGQYVSLPVAAVGSWDISKFKEIPPMQGFFVQATTTGGKLTMDFSKLVYSDVQLTNRPQRAPKQLRTPFCITVAGERLADEVYILQDETYTRGFDNGYDAHKMEGDERAPLLALRHHGEDFAIAAVPTADSCILVFRGGEDNDYTLRFSGVPEGLELVDLYTGTIVALSDQTTYSFSADNQAGERFLIRQAQVPGITTGIEQMGDTEGVRRVYDALGRRIDAASRPQGVYIVNTQTATGRIATKVIY